MVQEPAARGCYSLGKRFMDAIILFSHGSLLCGSGEALWGHARRLQARRCAPIVEVGYLNYSEPPFTQAVESVVAAGATRVVVTPYFLAPGKFVTVDLPQAVKAARVAHSSIEFVESEAIGYDERLADALIDSARHAFGQAAWREDMRRASAQCRHNPDCPLYGTPACPKQPPTPACANRGGIATVTPTGDSDVAVHSGPREIITDGNRPALLIMVHGSPRATANQDMFRVVESIQKRAVFPIVQVGFLECNEPDIPTAIELCAEQGATEVIGVPYFLHTGTHVADDLPTLFERAREQYPNIEFRMGEYLGRSERLTDILEDRAQAATAEFQLFMTP